MSKPIALINQPCGLGDILFTLKIGRVLSENYRVIWPIHSSYRSIKEKVSAGSIEFYTTDEDFPEKEQFRILSSQHINDCTSFTNGYLYCPITRSTYSKAAQKIAGYERANMFGKYAMCDVDPSNWMDSFSFVRDYQKESELYSFLKIDEPYHLVNSRFGTPPEWEVNLHKTIPTREGLGRIDIKIYDQYDVFDWLGVLEKASQIDTVATSLPFLFENLNLNCVPTIHSRNKNSNEAEENFTLMKEIYKKDYKYEA